MSAFSSTRRAMALLLCTSGCLVKSQETAATIPSFVTEYAPLVYLDVNELYLPSDIYEQIPNTYPEANFTTLDSSPLDLNNLSSLNTFDTSGCTIDNFGSDCDIYLTSKQNVSTNPLWLYGVLPDESTGETTGAVSTAVIVNDHGDGTVDAFYFYFYAFNLGLPFGEIVLGNHVGDWEHTMVRFVDGKPSTLWLSAHSDGFAYTYDAISKNGSRPLVYSSLGGHANYAVPGLQSRKYGVLVLNDTTSSGPLWDPVASAYFYTYTYDSSVPYNGTFTPAMSTGDCPILSPVDWLHFLGRWGDKQYNDTNPIQIDAKVSFAYEDGPTGPIDKDLQRNGTCPDSDSPCTTSSTLPVPSGTTKPAETVTRTYASTTTCSAQSTGSGSTAATGSMTSTGTPSASSTPPASTGAASKASGGTAWATSLAGLLLAMWSFV